MYAALRVRYFRDGGDDSGRDPARYVIPPPERVEVAWSTRLTASAGICYPQRRVIRLSVHYHARFPDEVEATLLHEMIHLVVPGHGPEFHRWLERIRAQGGAVSRFSRELAAPPRWEYVCPSCRRRFPRQRRLKGRGRHHRCKVCGPAGGPLVEVGPLVTRRR